MDRLAGIPKEVFYEEKGRRIPAEGDPERLIRYNKALALADIKASRSAQPTVLEIGCNQCVLLDRLWQHGLLPDYHGIDISRAAVEKGRPETVARAKITIQDISKGLDYRGEMFDYVFMLEVLEHLESPTFALQEIKRLLRKAGTLLVSVPNPYYWSEVLGHCLQRPETERHLSSFTYQTMRTLAESVGFTIASVCGTYVRVPFTRRLTGEYVLIPTDSLLTRSYIYKLVHC